MLDPTYVFLMILSYHYYSDFILQTDEEAKGKSKGSSLYNKALMSHVSTYSFMWFCAVWVMSHSIDKAIGFTAITFIAHYLTDWVTSRWGKIFWDKGDTHNGFCVVGFDQIIHYIQLWFTFKAIGLL